MPPVRRSLALVLLVAYTVLSSFGVGWVLCTEADGRVVLEGIAAGCCDETGEHAEPPGDVPEDEHRDCEDCSDVALADLTRSRHANDENEAPATPSCAPAACIADVVTWSPSPRQFRPTAPPRPPPQRAFLATTILLL